MFNFNKIKNISVALTILTIFLYASNFISKYIFAFLANQQIFNNPNVANYSYLFIAKQYLLNQINANLWQIIKTPFINSALISIIIIAIIILAIYFYLKAEFFSSNNQNLSLIHI